MIIDKIYNIPRRLSRLRPSSAFQKTITDNLALFGITLTDTYVLYQSGASSKCISLYIYAFNMDAENPCCVQLYVGLKTISVWVSTEVHSESFVSYDIDVDDTVGGSIDNHLCVYDGSSQEITYALPMDRAAWTLIQIKHPVIVGDIPNPTTLENIGIQFFNDEV